MTEITKFLKQIPKNAKVCIWGAGAAGIKIKEILEEKRKDVKVTTFIDTFKTGKIGDIEIYSANKLPEIKSQFNLLIVTTLSSLYIINTLLSYYDINNVIIIKKALYLSFFPICDQQKTSQVLKNLDSKKDKTLYKMLINARKTGDLEQIKRYVAKKYMLTELGQRTQKQYMEHINYDAIKTIIEGGIHDGSNTIIFKKRFKNLKKIYAFELIYENVKNPPFDNILKSMDELEIIKLGLWNKKDTLEFQMSGTECAGSTLSDTGLKREQVSDHIKISTISIDEFVNERNIDKIDFIKMDIEGAETNSLFGAKETLVKHRPQLAISIYHRAEDMYEIPLYLMEILPDYVFKIGHYSLNFCESILYAIPKELYKKD